ncbi:ABC transporter substrate-binding protein [Streptomyces brasiliscabiei]|uniref:ABC transporter substrate-binding protein n=1 Tax=Streptomyces brasiliscabiei TaxID=2736302 RepID=UPI001C121702|nr:ABC transporter substrate-binding protein [Streptomyces brasiliscabiei]
MRPRTPFATLAVGLVLTVTACGGGSSTSSSGGDGPIEIGMITSLTGSLQTLGTEGRKAAELAVDQINADGGVLGRQLKLTVKDDKSLPDQSVLAFNAFKDQGVAAVLGSPSGGSALATLPAVDRAEIPYLSLTPADEQVAPVHPYVFVVPALASDYAERLLQYYRSEGITRLAVAYDTKTSYPTSGYRAMKAMAAKYGVEIVATEKIQSTTSDFSAVFTHVKGTDAQALAVWVTGPASVVLTKQYAASGLDIPISFTGSQASKLWLDPAGRAAEGAIVASSIGVVGDTLPDGAQKKAIEAVDQPFQDKYDYQPPQFAQDGYTGVQLLAAAIEQARSSDHEKIRQAMEKLTLTTPNGTYRFSAENHSGLSADYISVNSVTDGAFVPTAWSESELEKVAK